MKRLLSTICAAAVAATMGVAPVAVAGPLSAPQLKAPEAAPVTRVDHRRWRYYSGGGTDPGGQFGGGYYKHKGYYKYRNHPRWKRRSHHRHRGGDWIVPFIGGAIIGGILSEATRPTVRHYRGDPHVAWCYRRYRSYRERDNSFQPYHGPRKPCISPYY